MKTGQFATLSAVSAILDLANGLENDKSLLTGLFAVELAQQSGLPAPAQRAAFFAGLLRHLGCTAYASLESRFAPDDILLRSQLLRGDTSTLRGVITAVRNSNPSMTDQVRGLARLAISSSTVRVEWTREACGAAHVLAKQLGLGEQVTRALDEVFERWNGQGSPAAVGGTDLSDVGRVAQVAHLAVLFLLSADAALAAEVLALRAGTVLDPTLAKTAADLLPSFALTGRSEDRLERVQSLLDQDPLPLTVEALAITFGDFADLQCPFTRGHSRRVAKLCVEAARELGLDQAELSDLAVAAHLHDLGQVAVPTGIWLRRSFSPSDLARAATHPFVTERILSAAPPLEQAAKIAGAHHERLDGQGYPRGLLPFAISRPARILAAADVGSALFEDRPHRTAQTPPRVRAHLLDEVKAKRLDPDCVNAVLRALGETELVRSSAAGLTAREVEVLRALAIGRTNKQIATLLGISDRTVQHHTIHIYEKLEVDTRAAAALLASRLGLL